jgi:PPP family 3-phenylpropionic acid transporter
MSFLPLIWLGWHHPGGAGAPVARPRARDAMRLLRSPAFVAAMIAGAALQGAHAPLYAYGAIHWSAAGISNGTIGALWAFGVAVEVAVLALFGKRLIDKFGVSGAFALSAFASLFRWIMMTLDPSLAWLWPLQALHGLTFTAAHLGAMAFVHAAAPQHLASTAQGLAGSLAGGAFMAAGSFLAAAVYPDFGTAAFWIGAAFSAVGLIAALALRRLWTGGIVI